MTKLQPLRLLGLCRKAGLLEQNLTARTLAKFYTNFTLIACYNKPLTQGEVFSVLRKMVLNHSTLSASYSSETNEIYVLERLLFKDVVEFRAGSHDMELLLGEIEQISFDLDTEKPVFKVIVIDGSKVAFVCDHSFMDGISGLNLQQIFAQELNGLTHSERAVEVADEALIFDLNQDKAVILKLPPCTELSLGTVADTRFKITKWIKSQVPQRFKEYLNDHDYNKVPELDIDGNPVTKFPIEKIPLEFKTLFKLTNLDAECTKKLLALSRSRGLTITPIIETVYLQTLVEHGVFLNSVGHSYYLDSMLPVNLRRFLPKSFQDQGAIGARLYLGIHNNVPINDLSRSIEDEDLFWRLCGDSANTIKSTALDNRGPMNFYNASISNYDPDSPDKMVAAVKRAYDNRQSVTTRFSNLGILHQDAGDEYQVEDLVFSQAVGCNGGKTVLNVISTRAGGINLCLSCVQGPVKDEQDLARYSELLKSRLIKLVSSVE